MTGSPVEERGATSHNFVVRSARPEDEEALEAMFEACFGTPRSRREWRWRWFGASGSRGEALVLESDGVAVGHWACSISDMWLAGQRKRVMLGGEVMVLPAFRRRGGMGMLIAAGREIADAHADVWVGFATDDATRVTGANGGGRVIGRMPTWIVWPKEIPRLPWPIGSLAARTLTAWRAIAFALLPCTSVEVITAASCGELDELAESAASYSVCMRIRDCGYIRWRWLERPEGDVVVLGARTRSGQLRGYAVFGVESSGDRRLGRVLDLLASDRAALRGLLRQALKTMTADGCEVITFDYLDTRRWAQSFLRFAGFARRPGKTMTALCTSAGSGLVPESLGSWYLTRGDTDVS